MPVDASRIRGLNNKPVREGAEYVLYWAQMNRRVEGNHGLAHAIDSANELRLPLLYYEGLTCSYPYANDRLHTFILEGVPDTAAALKKLGIGYVLYLRRALEDRNDVLYDLASRAAVVVTDDYPTFIAADHNSRVPERVDCRYTVVDSSCVVPMSLLPKREYAAYTIRPKITRLLPEHLKPVEVAAPARRFTGAVPVYHTDVNPESIPRFVASCDIDHSVRPSTAFMGGAAAARRRLSEFLESKLRMYARAKNEPSAHATSELSPYLHFGQISPVDVALAAQDYANEEKLMAGEFLEELIVRRELAFNFTRHTREHCSLAALPEWARKTLGEHDGDRRDPCYSREQLELGQTYDALWNATEKELLIRGKIHGYYRMYWGKKIIEWTASHEEALDVMIYLHDRYALDGRDANTYTNVLWCFGLHDRPWFDRPIFGQVRYMSFEGMKRKTKVDAYIAEIAALERSGEDPLRLSA